MLSVYEGSPEPAVLTLRSTIPITCTRRESALKDSCALTLKLTTSNNILVRHNYGRECIMTLTEKDWKDGEKKAYRLEERIEIFAKVDSFMTGPRRNSLTIDIDSLPNKVTADGHSYKNMWSRHSLPEIEVYHHDAPQGVCWSTGDPHVTTFDRRFYTIYATGQFTYVQTTRGIPIEIQLRHKPCGQTVSCVCGVAARENDTILVADMCADSRLHFITHSNELREGASIKTDANGRVFEINLPSKVKVVAYVNYWGMSIGIYVTSSEYGRIEGLCGSLDNNPENDLKIKGGNEVTDSVGDVVKSWRVPLGKSLFDGVATNLPVGTDPALDDEPSFCTCLQGISSCQNQMVDNNFPSGPNVGANTNVIPKTVGKLSTNNPVRSRRALIDKSMTDDIDWEYDSLAFNFSSPEPAERPENSSTITEEEATTHCRQVLWEDGSLIRVNCESLVLTRDVEGIINKCSFDIQMTNDKSWADDKIPEIQNLCIFEAMTANITENNSTIEEIISFVKNMTALICLPQSCSGHGTCENGTCICEQGYVGSDCALSEDAVPNIVRTLGPSPCDLDRYPCQKVEMVTKDVKSLPTLICKVEITKSDNSTQSFNTSVSVETMETTSCKLPTDELHGGLRILLSNSTSTTSPPDDEFIDFYFLPLGSPVLQYSISISNNGILFSNASMLTVFDSKCFSCNLHNCSQKEGTCLINGYCFANGQRSPFNSEWHKCDPSVSTTLWTMVSGNCTVHPEFDDETNGVLGVAPFFGCPTLEGPVVIDRTWIEFYCVIPTTETSDQAAFSVTFLFDEKPEKSVPSVVVRPTNLNETTHHKATLHERYLTQKLLGKRISCRVFSFWLKSANIAHSHALTSANHYWAGIEVSSHMLSVYEGDPEPAVLTLKSTIPITCNQREGAYEDSCALTLKLTTSSNILVRHNYGRECIMTLSEKDWKDGEKKAYRLEERIEIFAKVDSFMTGPRWNSLTIDIDSLSNKVTADGQSYKNMWSRHSLPAIGVYHHDAPQGVCWSTGDPHVTTFDRRFYTIYATGQFAYVQTTRGIPIEVQLRHKPCGRAVSCVCGVAARENDTILVADMCADSRLHFVTHSNELREGASIKTGVNGRVFEINLPSKVKVVGYVNYWGMSVGIYVTSSEYGRIEGLCGSLDNDPDNDLKVKGGNEVTDSVSDVVKSWRVPLGKSLFDGVATNLPVGTDPALDDEPSFCTCLQGISSCQNQMVDNNFPSGPNVGANSNIIPKIVGKLSTNNPGRSRRALIDKSMTDDIDWEYDSSAFNFSTPEPLERPENTSAFTQEEAALHCQQVLWDDGSPFRANCESLVSTRDVDGIINKCTFDIQMTDDKSWADDKIPEIQNLCIFEVMTANITENNSTIEEITSFVKKMAALICLPQSCSGHGTCENGSCICEQGYVGSDCALSEDAVPNIVRTLGPSPCDLDRYPCQKVEMITKDVKSLPTIICKVEVTKSDNSTQSFNTSATLETMDTTSCKLPTDELHGALRILQSNSTSTTSPPDDEFIDFYSLPVGNPVLHYSISISNNGILFSNASLLTVYDSKCLSCNLHFCSQKEETCLINGYCFANGQISPFNPEWHRCDPSVSTTLWTMISGNCTVHQQVNEQTNGILGVSPFFGCPTLEGPVVIDRTWVEFYCVIPTTEISDQASFNVTFLFNGEPVPTVPSVIARSPHLKVTLHERNLTHKLLGKWISCRVFSFWLKYANKVRSQTLTSANSYWAGIEVSSDVLSVYEGDPEPVVLTLRSTIPITCNRREGAREDSCALNLTLTTSNNILVRHNYGRECIMTLTEKDWKDGEKKAYRLEESIEIFAKIDSFMTSPRRNSLTIDIDTLPNKVTAEGHSYKNMWSRHSLPAVGVYHHDIPQGVCWSTGDPHVTTFDRRFYTIYATGQFTYVQTTRGQQIEVQLRHKPCGRRVSCVCGVAAREKDTILVADMCADSRPHFVTPSNKLRDGASIKTDANGRVFEINLPSKVKVVGYVNYWGMNVGIYVTSSQYGKVEGLCGSLDNNRNNDLQVKGGNKAKNSVDDVVESWRIPLGKSLFDGVVTNLPVGTDAALYDSSSFCTCLEGISSCQRWVEDNNFPSGPNVGANNNIIPKTVVNVSTNNHGRRRRALNDKAMTDDIDWEYDSSAFHFSSPEPLDRPANSSVMTQKDARLHCQRVLWDEGSPVRSKCESLVSMSSVEGIVNKCIFDIQMTGDESWADDKIPEIQNLCIFEATTANITESNSTTEAITSFAKEIAALICLPQNCSGQGTCENGICVCNAGFVGTDCALSENAVPNINRTLGPSFCDFEVYPCQKVEMVTNDVKSLPTLICKVDVTKSDNSTQSFKTSASVETMDTTSCKLPTDELHGSLQLLESNSAPTLSPEDEPVDFYSLPAGSPVLHYSISISNNGILFSNARLLTVYDSKCFSCNLHSCSQKEGTCLINGYCFVNGQVNPFNPEWYRCDPSVSTTLWTKVPDVAVIAVATVTVIAVILTVIAVYFIIRRK